MTQSPYSGLGTEVLEPAPQRTSVLAILALVLAIVSIVPLFCVVPGSGALAVVLGGAALLFINRERGRLSGTGLAATGIVLGLMVTVLQIVAVVMISRGMQFYKQNIVGPIDKALVALDTGDLKTARTMFAPATKAKITDEQLRQFVKDYQAHLGHYKGFPDSILGTVQTWFQVGQAMQGLKGRGDVMPFPGQFDKGPAVIGIMIDPQGTTNTPGSSVNFSVLNIGVFTTDNQTFWLIDPSTIPMGGTVRITPKPGGGVEVQTGPGKGAETSPVAPEPEAAPDAPEKPDPAPKSPGKPPAP